MKIMIIIGVGALITAFSPLQKYIPGYQPLGCGQNVHSYAIARDCEGGQ